MGQLWAGFALVSLLAAGPGDLEQRLTEATRLRESGSSSEALKAFRDLLPLATAEDPRRAAILEAMAELETDAGEYADAVRDAADAARLHAASGRRGARASALNLVGLASLYAGDYAVATRALEQAIGLSKAVGDDAGLAEELTNLANVAYFVGRYGDAAAGYDAALRIADARAGEPWASRRRRLVLTNQATLDQRLGRYESALARYRAVRATGTDLRPREQAQILANLGALYRRLGDPIKALAAYDEARALFSRERHVDGELGVMKNRGIVLALDLGRLEDAEQSFSESLDGATEAGNRREALQALLYRGETELRRGALDRARRDFQSSLVEARALGTPEEEWKALYGMGRVALEGGDEAGAAAPLEAAVAVIEAIREAVRVPALRSDFFADKREVYDALISVKRERGSAARIFELIERSHSRAWREKLGLHAPVTLSAVQAALPPGALLLETWSSSYGSAVLSVTRDSAQVIRSTVEETAVARLIEAVASAPGADWRTPASEIAARLLPGAWPHGPTHVVVVPDRTLALVPFELLPVGGRLLLEQASVSYLPTAALLLRPAPPAQMIRPPWALQLRAFGDPAFSSARLDDATGVRARLASSGAEVRSIASELGGTSALFLGRGDRKARLYDAGRQAPLLHIATHAVADTEAMEQSRLLFSPPGDAASEGDYLFLREAYELPLSGVELAVLSACETERGHQLRGEGVQSFSRAFLAAGARSTVTTLWSVPDRATASFMAVFYHHLQRGLPRAEALRQAKLRFVTSGTALGDPHYWAAFVLTGEGTSPVPRALRWSSVGFALLGLSGAAVLVASLRGRRGGRRPRTREDARARTEEPLP